MGVFSSLEAKSPCDAYAFSKIPAIVLITLIGILTKYLGVLFKRLLSSTSHSYTTVAWFAAFALQLGIGYFLQDFLHVRNMWKNPF